MRRALRSLFERVLHCGVDGSAPAFLVDRIVYSNWVYLVATIVNLMAVQANVSKGYVLLLVLNCTYQVGVVLGFVLNARRCYLAGRLVFLGIIYGALGVACAIQGPVVQMEHFYLPFITLALSMFHPSERRYSFGFAVAGALLYLYFAGRAQPLFDVDPWESRYAADDLRTNKLSYTVLLVLSVLGMSNAYGRAIKAVDDQRARLFEHGRLTAIGSMACNVAHEINTPLMAMAIHLDVLECNVEGRPDRAEERDAVERLGQLARRIAAIVRSFKLLSHSESNDPMTDVTIGALVESTLDIARGRCRPLGVDLSVHIDAPQHLLHGRIVALSQVVLNLLNNSCDAVGELEAGQRWIRIDSATVGDTVQLSVTDSGRIESPDVRAKLFEPFFTTKPIGKGTGLGLSISRQAVEQHGGRLYVDVSSVNTRFVIELPARAAAQPDRPVA